MTIRLHHLSRTSLLLYLHHALLLSHQVVLMLLLDGVHHVLRLSELLSLRSLTTRRRLGPPVLSYVSGIQSTLRILSHGWGRNHAARL